MIIGGVFLVIFGFFAGNAALCPDAFVGREQGVERAIDCDLEYKRPEREGK